MKEGLALLFLWVYQATKLSSRPLADPAIPKGLQITLALILFPHISVYE